MTKNQKVLAIGVVLLGAFVVTQKKETAVVVTTNNPLGLPDPDDAPTTSIPVVVATY